MRYLLALALVVLTSSVAHADHHKRKAVSRFNGKDVAGWVVMCDGDWKVEEGVIVGRKGVKWTTDPKKSGSWLRTEKEYSNFVFEFEYAINKKGNSGVFLRSGLKENPAFTGHEMQILDDHGRAKPEVWSTGALYDVVAAKKRREIFSERIHNLLSDGSALCLPTSPGIAPERGASGQILDDFRGRAMALLCTAGLAGLPQITLPLASLENCPLGLSLVGRRGSDMELMTLAEDLATES